MELGIGGRTWTLIRWTNLFLGAGVEARDLFLLYFGTPDKLSLFLVQAFFKIFNPVFLISNPSHQGLFRQLRSSLPRSSSCPLYSPMSAAVAPDSLSCLSLSSHVPASRSSVVASLAMLEVPQEDGGGGGSSGQVVHLLCSGWHLSDASPSLFLPLATIGPSS